MKIHLYTITWNEEYILPYFLKHYSKYCDKIVIMDNESTDNTVSIAKSFPSTDVRSWSSNNEINDGIYLQIKNNIYKESRGIADWVIVCDCDEFLYHPNMLNILENYSKSGINYPKIQGYEMMPNCELNPDDDLPIKYQIGTRFTNLDKRAIFNPSLDMSYGFGCHTANLPFNSVESPKDDIYMMHYKMINLNYFINRHSLLASRLSGFNKQFGLGSHYQWSREMMTNNYNDFLTKASKVL